MGEFDWEENFDEFDAFIPVSSKKKEAGTVIDDESDEEIFEPTGVVEPDVEYNKDDFKVSKKRKVDFAKVKAGLRRKDKDLSGDSEPIIPVGVESEDALDVSDLSDSEDLGLFEDMETEDIDVSDSKVERFEEPVGEFEGIKEFKSKKRILDKLIRREKSKVDIRSASGEVVETPDSKFNIQKIVKIKELPMWLIILSQVLLLLVGILLGFVVGHTKQEYPNNFEGLSFEQAYEITSIRLGSTVEVDFTEYNNGSYGKLIKFTHKHETEDDVYYRLFKYYLKEKDIVVYTDRGDLSRLKVSTDTFNEDQGSYYVDEEMDDRPGFNTETNNGEIDNQQSGMSESGEQNTNEPTKPIDESEGSSNEGE